jgi:hypothetical protein
MRPIFPSSAVEEAVLKPRGAEGAGCVDEGLEEAVVGGVGEVFGVPLYAEPEGEGGVFEGFDEAVGGKGAGNEAVAEAVDALVVAGIDGQAGEVKDGGEAGAGVDFDVVGVNAVAGFAVGEAVGEVGEMLVEGAAALDVHDLAAHADAEGGQGVAFGECEDGEVEVLAVFRGEAGGGVFGLAIERGVEVIAAGEEEGVEGGEHFEAEVGVVGDGEEDGHATGVEDSAGVVGGEFEGLAVLVGGADVEGDADAGAGMGGRRLAHGTPAGLAKTPTGYPGRLGDDNAAEG